MILLYIWINCLVWSKALAVPLWEFYDNPSWGYQDEPSYQKKRLDYYKPMAMRRTRQEPVGNGWQPVYQGNEYKNLLNSYDDLEKEGRWQDEYNTMDEGYDTWNDRDQWQQVLSDYTTTPSLDLNYNEVYKALQRWKEEENDIESEDAYPSDPDAYYIQVDEKESGEWEREPLDGERLRRVFDSRPESREPTIGYEGDEPSRSRNGMDPFQQIGLKLVDLTKESEEDDAGFDDSMEREAEMSYEGEGGRGQMRPVSVKRAKSLLKELEVAEHKRGTTDDASPSKERVDKAELEAMFNKVSASDEAEDSGSDEEDEKRTEQESSEADSKETKATVEQLETEATVEQLETELGLMQEENGMLIAALELSPLEKISSQANIQRMRTLIRKAASRQDLIDIIAKQSESDEEP